MKYIKLQKIVTFLCIVMTLPLFAQDNTITVTGEKRTNIEKAGTSTTVTGQDIEDKSSKVLKDELVYIPGMQVETQRKGTRTFSMRGYSMSKVAMLVDGIPVMDSYSGSFDIDNIGLLDVSDIIVTRGTSSALYGARGTVGSINIIKAPPKKMYINTAAEVDHLYNHVLSVSHGMPIGDFYYMISASYDKSNGYTVSKKLDRKTREDWLLKLSSYDKFNTTLNDFLVNARPGNAVPYYLTDSGKWDHINHEKYKVNGKIGYHITEKLETGITAFYNKSEMNNSIYLIDMYPVYRYTYLDKRRQWVNPSFTSPLGNVSSRWPEYDDYALSPFINYKGESFELKLNAFFYEQYNKYISYIDPKEIAVQGNLDTVRQVWSIWKNNTYGFNIYPSYKITKDNKLNFAITYYVGSHLEYEQAFNSKSTDVLNYFGKEKYKSMEIGASYLTLAVEDEIKFGRAVELSLGVSYDAQNVNKYQRKEKNPFGNTKMYDCETGYTSDPILWGTQDSFNPVIGIVGKVTENLQLRGSASYKTSFPSLQAYASTESSAKVGESPDDTSYEKLKPEKSVNGNAGIELAFFDHSLTVGCDYFFSSYQDRLVRFYETRQDDYVYRNMDFSYLHGTETVLKWDLWDVFDTMDISLGLTHTYIYARNLTKMRLSSINRGVYFERLPEHKFTLDFKMNIYKTKTSLFVFGYYEYGQIQYATKYNPMGINGFTTDCWTPVMLNDPLMIDVKISQKIYTSYGEYEIYIMCKNIMDDYLADPFNPGPGRIFYAGLKAGW